MRRALYYVAVYFAIITALYYITVIYCENRFTPLPQHSVNINIVTIRQKFINASPIICTDSLLFLCYR